MFDHFPQRQRALQHLLCGKRPCLTAIRENFPPGSDERIAEILEEDRIEKRRATNNHGSRNDSDLPAVRHAGPLRPWRFTVGRWHNWQDNRCANWTRPGTSALGGQKWSIELQRHCSENCIFVQCLFHPNVWWNLILGHFLFRP